ncbi:ABC transporter related protein [Kribbella flavida DSM 17836]|uniref:ABC transporter related protein n=1 Tax=Kribbella flavida (strain DSM 17836 / JCM 10339 / NBRC 14399) TaxID=479435 RepID=D2PW91_KRIFD|nr:ABC transporter ATP-binding protein [Kribbella flavida]ADB31543.1 ABC transporter related protein [Kribbella flavida DSM 17836]
MTTFGAVLRHGRGWLPLIGAAALLGSLTVLALPTVLGRAVDAVVTEGPAGRWVVVACCLIAIGVACDLVEVVAGTACVAGTTAWLRNRLVRHVLASGPEGTSKFDTGDLVTRVSSNAHDAALAGPATVTAVAAAVPPVGSLVLLAVIDPWLAAAFLAGVLLVGVVLWAFTRRTAEISLAYQKTQGRIAAALTEALAGIRTIVSAGTVLREERRILRPLPQLHDQGLRTWRVLARSGAQAAVAGPLVLIAVLAVGGIQLVNGRITPGEYFAAAQYAVIGAGLGSLTGVLGELARARAGINRAAEVTGVAPVAYGTLSLPAGPGRLTFDDVVVRAGDRLLLDRVNLDLPGGAAVAVVGPSGAGKSVLAAVAGRLRDPDSGQVQLDGMPLAGLSHRALRRAVKCAFERPALVGSTVGEAVSVGSVPSVPLLAAARATHVHDFVSRMPAGYRTPLAEAPLSGGEAQRLGLARAWTADRLLILDDATSSLDTATELQISKTLMGDRQRRTRLIVTHRAATAARADLVVWLDRGRVRGVGPHYELWADPAYREVFG